LCIPTSDGSDFNGGVKAERTRFALYPFQGQPDRLNRKAALGEPFMNAPVGFIAEKDLSCRRLTLQPRSEVSGTTDLGQRAALPSLLVEVFR
jgi:hypothetical protein